MEHHQLFPGPIIECASMNFARLVSVSNLCMTLSTRSFKSGGITCIWSSLSPEVSPKLVRSTFMWECRCIYRIYDRFFSLQSFRNKFSVQVFNFDSFKLLDYICLGSRGCILTLIVQKVYLNLFDADQICVNILLCRRQWTFHWLTYKLIHIFKWVACTRSCGWWVAFEYNGTFELMEFLSLAFHIFSLHESQLYLPIAIFLALFHICTTVFFSFCTITWISTK